MRFYQHIALIVGALLLSNLTPSLGQSFSPKPAASLDDKNPPTKAESEALRPAMVAAMKMFQIDKNRMTGMAEAEPYLGNDLREKCKESAQALAVVEEKLTVDQRAAVKNIHSIQRLAGNPEYFFIQLDCELTLRSNGKFEKSPFRLNLLCRLTKEKPILIGMKEAKVTENPPIQQ